MSTLVPHSLRSVAVRAVGASAIAGAVLFGAAPIAQAAPLPGGNHVVATGFQHGPMPQHHFFHHHHFWHHHHHFFWHPWWFW